MATLQVNLLRILLAYCVVSLIGNGRVLGQGNEPSRSLPTKLKVEHLPNAIQVHPKVISGGLPEGDAAFQELRSLGVKTIVSVDGAKPDVALAKRYGLRYVHLPHGYNGISDERILDLAKAVRDLDGPIYMHCHHGKHRSPAAATVACVANGWIEPKSAVGILKLAGTSESYKGLFQSVQATRPVEEHRLDQLDTPFVEIAKLPPMAEAMVELERTHDHLKLLAKSGWKSTKSHPDLDAAHESLMMMEHFREMKRMESVSNEPARFLELISDSETASSELESALKEWEKTASPIGPGPAADKAFQRLSNNCTSCHQQFRDAPLRRNVQP